MTAESDRVTYLRWKARESRVAARFIGDEKGRLTLLKMAQIYDRLAQQLTEPWAAEGQDRMSDRPTDQRAARRGRPAPPSCSK